MFTNRLSLIILCCIAGLQGCEKNEAPQVSDAIKISVQEITGTNSQRIDQIEALLKQYLPFPRPLEDAHFLEKKIGDGVMGPSDYQRFYTLTASSTNISSWVKTLKLIEQNPTYIAPPVSPPWWVTAQGFNALRFYKLATPSGDDQGWIGVSDDLKIIYIYTFTT
jgi:hypothetical protein